ncbi:MAG TPA: tetratricopeptide repeat protein, partial [Anaerolineae bacterium]|nr:tetratricopeptide repeat protein [Anaerolineae bacterium]
ALENQGKLDEAASAYQQVLDFYPDDQTAVAGLASIKEKRGEIDAAYLMLQPQLVRSTAGLKAALTLSRVCSRYGNCAEVISLLESLLRGSDLTKREQASVHFTLGWLHEKAGNMTATDRHTKQGNLIKLGLKLS